MTYAKNGIFNVICTVGYQIVPERFQNNERFSKMYKITSQTH